MEPRETILLFASNLASCVGKNKYAPRSEAFHKLWLHLRPDTVVPVNAPVLGLDADAAAAVVAASPTCDTVQSVVQSATEKVKDAVSDTWSAAPVSTELAAVAKRALTEDAVSELAAQVEADTSLSADAKKDVMERVKKQRRMVQEVKEVVSAAQCSLGTVQESSSRVQYEEAHKQAVVHDNKFHKRWMGRTRSGRRWGLGGRVDGVDSEGRVVEIKNRVRCFFRTVPEYEHVQLQAYMVLLDVEEGILLQQYGGTQRSTIITRDREEWESVVLPEMQSFVDVMDAFLDTPAWTEAWVAAGADKVRREALLREWEALVRV